MNVSGLIVPKLVTREFVSNVSYSKFISGSSKLKYIISSKLLIEGGKKVAIRQYFSY